MTPSFPPGRGLPTVLERSTFAGFKIGQKNWTFQFEDTILGIFSETLTNLIDMVWEISEDGDIETFRLF